MLETFALIFLLGPAAEAFEPQVTPLEYVWRATCHTTFRGVWVSQSPASDGYQELLKPGQISGCFPKER